MDSFLKLADNRKRDDEQIWISGCSFANGFGVHQTQRFGSIISNRLNLPVSFLTKNGSSVAWAADQILRSDIRENDIVVWGLTGSSRLTYLSDDNTLYDVSNSNFNSIDNLKLYINQKLLVSNHMLYESFIRILEVQNFLYKINAKFILAVLPLNSQEHDLKILDFVKQLPQSVILFDPHNITFIDYAFDNMHPGQKHHAWYSEKILDHYHILYS